jgi:hypothetical protein
MIFDFTNTIKRFSVPIEVTRQDEGQYVDGRYVRPKMRTFQANGVAYPATTEDLQLLDEGAITNGSLAVFTSCELRVGGTDDAMADDICYQGRKYRVSAEKDYVPEGNYYKYICTRLGQ